MLKPWLRPATRKTHTVHEKKRERRNMSCRQQGWLARSWLAVFLEEEKKIYFWGKVTRYTISNLTHARAPPTPQLLSFPSWYDLILLFFLEEDEEGDNNHHHHQIAPVRLYKRWIEGNSKLSPPSKLENSIYLFIFLHRFRFRINWGLVGNLLSVTATDRNPKIYEKRNNKKRYEVEEQQIHQLIFFLLCCFLPQLVSCLLVANCRGHHLSFSFLSPVHSGTTSAFIIYFLSNVQQIIAYQCIGIQAISRFLTGSFDTIKNIHMEMG